MAIGNRISFFRKRKGMTQKHLGQILGYPEKSADVRIAQYESGKRTPKEESIKELAAILDISPLAISNLEVDSYNGLMHTLFIIEDQYGIKIGEMNGDPCFFLDRSHPQYPLLFDRLSDWKEIRVKLKSGEISEEEYNQWRYKYSKEE